MINLVLVNVCILSTLAIRFHYHLPLYQVQCFHETVEQNSRFQIAIKAESSAYYLHVVDKQPLHEDSRTTNAEYKFFSAFAEQSEILTFCIGNLDNKQMLLDIQFYHGMYLEDGFQNKIKGHQLSDLSVRWRQMLKMVQSNYHTYEKKILGQRPASKRISMILRIMMGVIIGVTMVIKVLYYHKVRNYLKEKKAV